MERSDLKAILPFPVMFTGDEMDNERATDNVVAFVENWFQVQAAAGMDIREATAAWRKTVGRDDMIVATVAEFEAENHNRDPLIKWSHEELPKIGARMPEKIIVRLHPEGWNRYWSNVSSVSMVLPRMANRLDLRCNFRQPENLVTISDREVSGDIPCEVKLLR